MLISFHMWKIMGGLKEMCLNTGHMNPLSWNNTSGRFDLLSITQPVLCAPSRNILKNQREWEGYDPTSKELKL